MGYADDLSVAKTGKTNTDQVHQMVFDFEQTWRLDYNANKSASLYREIKDKLG